VNTRGRVVVVGTLNVDLIWEVPVLPRAGQTVIATATQRQFGGKGANQAVAATRQGAKVALVGAVGDDIDGSNYCAYLRGEGIDVASVSAVAGVSTGTAHVYVEPAGENLIVVNPGANARLDAARAEAVLRGADVLLVQLECGLAAAVGVLRLAAKHHVRALLNASPSRADFPWGELAIDTLIVNEHECRDCCRLTPEELECADHSVRQQILGRLNVSHLVITRGAASTLHLTADGATQVPTLPVTPVDTVGAGDTFAGTLATELAAGRGWESAIRHANVAAALSTLTLGAQAAMPTRAQVETALASLRV
jgi:ribokinase